MQADVTPRIIRTANFATDAAQFILDRARPAIAARGIFRLALSGGETPRRIHHELTRLAGDLPWAKVIITFGDERCVPPEDPASNFGMAKSSLLEAVDLPDENILRIQAELEPTLAARQYEEALGQLAQTQGEPIYVHDLILLGIGEDGHTASLFPGTAALAESERMVVANWVPKLSAHRITFTYPLIAAARRVCFLAGDPGKRQVIDEILAGDPRHPASRVAAQPTTTFLLGY